MASNLEINPNHEVVSKLKGMLDEDGKPTSEAAPEYAELLYDVAAVSSGYELSDPAAFAKRVVALMANGEDALADLVAGMAESGGAGASDEKNEEKSEEGGDDPIVPEVV